jgi:hypothetical protein
MHLRLYREGVRGSAYPDQTKAEIEGIQGLFEKWFEHMIGIGPQRAVALIDAIHEQMVRNRDEARAAVTPALHLALERVRNSSTDLSKEDRLLISAFTMSLPDAVPVAHEQLNWMPEAPALEEWRALITLVGLTQEECSKLGQPSDVKTRPLFVLANERVLFFDFSCMYDELFGAFDRVARSDQQFYDRRYRKNQTEWMEHEIGALLRRVFPSDNVFTTLLYPDPDNPGGEAELDAAVKWGPFLVLVEAKGCQFRFDVVHSDMGRLRADMEKNVADAFDQAQRASRYIASVPTAVFREKHSGKELHVVGKEIRRVFKVSVTLHHLADLTAQLANLRVLNLFKSGDYPFSVSLGDLEIITRFCESPDIFLHYIQRRLELQRSGMNIQGGELDIFGIYLDSRLEPAQFWERKSEDRKELAMMMLMGGSERFDRWKNAQLGIGKAPEITLKLPNAVKTLLSELRRRQDEGARWIAFSVLSLSHEGIARLDRLLTKIRLQDLNGGQIGSAVFVDGDVIAVLTAGYGHELNDLRETLFARVSLEKYRRHSEKALGFTFLINDPSQVFDFALWVEGPWEHNPEMERVVRDSRTLKAWPGQRLPGRNDPCLCGSGKKFKKCCLVFFGKNQNK